MTPTGRSDVPRSRSALAAPASTTTRPSDGFAYFRHSLKLDTRRFWTLNDVPSRSPARARAIAPGRVPLRIVAGMPAAVAISAATTFERIPPDPSGEVDTP